MKRKFGKEPLLDGHLDNRLCLIFRENKNRIRLKTYSSVNRLKKQDLSFIFLCFQRKLREELD